MTERQAWKTIADAYATPRGERTEKQRRITNRGICASLVWLPVGWTTELQMKRKVYQSMPPTGRTIALPAEFGCKAEYYFCPLTPANDLLRADYCYAMYYSNGAE